MKNQDVLTVQEIKEIKDLNKLNTLIKQYEKELNRRMRILEKYKTSDEALYKIAERSFAAVSGKPGFKLTKIESEEAKEISVARSRLINLSQTLTSGKTQIRSLRTARNKAIAFRERELYKALNVHKKVVTLKKIRALDAEDWEEIRRLLDKHSYLSSGDTIETFITEDIDYSNIYTEKEYKEKDKEVVAIVKKLTQAKQAETMDDKYRFEW